MILEIAVVVEGEKKSPHKREEIVIPAQPDYVTKALNQIDTSTWSENDPRYEVLSEFILRLNLLYVEATLDRMETTIND